MDDIAKYVIQHCIRGTCTCGRCINASTKFQPNGHTSDVQFFKVVLKNYKLTAEDKEIIKNNFIQLAKSHKGIYSDINIFDGDEHNFIDIGRWIGDQSLALMLMGMGELLGIWKVATPNRIAPDFSEETRNMLAGAGYISIQYKNDGNDHGNDHKKDNKKE